VIFSDSSQSVNVQQRDAALKQTLRNFIPVRAL